MRVQGRPGGKDEISEVKLWTPLRGGLPVGVGRTATGGNPGSVGDKFAFGNTEERARLANMGCKQRGSVVNGRSTTPPAKARVKSQRGHYHDGIFTKRNKFNLLLHETFGGGFCSRRQQLQRSTALRATGARLNARALTAPRSAYGRG